MSESAKVGVSPGPWFVDPSFDRDIKSADGMEIAVVLGAVGTTPSEEAAEANARLIAASWELLELRRLKRLADLTGRTQAVPHDRPRIPRPGRSGPRSGVPGLGTRTVIHRGEQIAIPGWCKWITTDANGDIRGYASKPAPSRAHWIPLFSFVDIRDSGKPHGFPVVSDWKDSLQEIDMSTEVNP